tara:strand:+ start:194 stop:1063 length:870 start_codon:yes stop_codon:yes gene_type:complete
MLKIYKILTLFIVCTFSLNANDYYKDTDEDGYTDKQEQKFGSDPNDASSVIYKGGWPYNMYKDNAPDPGFRGCTNAPYGNGCDCQDDSECMQGSICGYQYQTRQCVPLAGTKVPRFIGVDQFGDYFDLYDLMNQGYPILIELSAMYMNPANLLSSWFSSGDESVFEMKWWQPNFEQMKAIVDAGEIYYVRILHKGSAKGEPVDIGDATIWNDAYPHVNIITVTDPEERMKTWFRPTGLPALFMLNQDMTIRVPAEGVAGDTQMRRGVKSAFEAVMFDNYMKTMHGKDKR